IGGAPRSWCRFSRCSSWSAWVGSRRNRRSSSERSSSNARRRYRMGSPPVPTPTDVVEALLFASDTPLEAERIREVLDLADVHEARRLIDELRARYEASSQGLQIVEVGGGYRMVTRSEVAPGPGRLARARTGPRLSRPPREPR